MSLTGIPELKDSYAQLGAGRFWLIMAGVLTYIGIGAALAITLDYPKAYGSMCRRKCLIEDYWFSPALLTHGNLLDYCLFAWLWSMPAAAIGVILWSRLRKRSDA